MKIILVHNSYREPENEDTVFGIECCARRLGGEPWVTLEDDLAVTFKLIEKELRAGCCIEVADAKHAVAAD